MNSSSPPEAISVIPDIPYLSHRLHATSKNRLDVYLPTRYLTATETPRPSVPIVVVLHGGGWQRGSKSNEWRGAPSVARAAARSGHVAIAVGYRLARVSLYSLGLRSLILSLLLALPISLLVPFSYGFSFLAALAPVAAGLLVARARPPAALELADMIDDIAQSIAFIRSQIHSYSNGYGDLDNLFLVGHSAAAHLVALMVLNKQFASLLEFESDNRVEGQDHKDQSATATTLKGAALSAALAETSSSSTVLSSIRGVVTISGIYNLYNPLHASTWYPKNIFFRAIYSSSIVQGRGNAENLLKISPIVYLPLEKTGVFDRTEGNRENGENEESHRNSDDLREIPLISLDSSNSPDSFPPPPTNSSIDSLIDQLSRRFSSQINQRPPPFLVLNAQNDLGLELDGLNFAQRLHRVHRPVEFSIIPNTNHATIVNKFLQHAGEARMIQFIEKYRKRGKENPQQIDKQGENGK